MPMYLGSDNIISKRSLAMVIALIAFGFGVLKISMGRMANFQPDVILLWLFEVRRARTVN